MRVTYYRDIGPLVQLKTFSGVVRLLRFFLLKKRFLK